MTFKNFMYKGVLMIAVLALIGWLGKYLYLVDGEIDCFRLMLVYGVPVGIPYMFFIIPARWDLSGTIGMVALCAIIGAVFGFIIAIGIAIRAVWYGGKLSYEDIAAYTELTIEEVEKIASEKKSA